MSQTGAEKRADLGGYDTRTTRSRHRRRARPPGEIRDAAGAMAAGLPDPDAGFFGPGSMVWRINGELVVYLAGPRALLLQLAHPKVAQALLDWSAIRRKPTRRLVSTLDAMDTLLFGGRDEALRASRRMAALHALVVGELREDAGRHVRGEAYAATDPELLRWVLATLVDSTLLAYEVFVAPLGADEKERYYQEIVARAPLLGLSPEGLPPSYTAFAAYFRAAVEDLAVGEAGRTLARVVIEGPLPGRAGAFAFSTLAAAMLPERIRADFGLPSTWREKVAFRGIRAAARAAAGVMRGVRRTARRSPGCPFARLLDAMSPAAAR
jgi:uncharacterized protein (DUF2236 family)